MIGLGKHVHHVSAKRLVVAFGVSFFFVVVRLTFLLQRIIIFVYTRGNFVGACSARNLQIIRFGFTRDDIRNLELIRFRTIVRRPAAIVEQGFAVDFIKELNAQSTTREVVQRTERIGFAGFQRKGVEVGISFAQGRLIDIAQRNQVGISKIIVRFLFDEGLTTRDGVESDIGSVCSFDAGNVLAVHRGRVGDAGVAGFNFSARRVDQGNLNVEVIHDILARADAQRQLKTRGQVEVVMIHIR